MISHPEVDPPVTETHEYGFLCTFDGNGGIYNRNNELLWSFRTLYQKSRQAFPCRIFRLLPDFVLCDASEQELLMIRCERRYPLPYFVMLDHGYPVCTIKQVSVLQKRYVIEFDGGYKWVFQIPLFTVFYKGVSESGMALVHK